MQCAEGNSLRIPQLKYASAAKATRTINSSVWLFVLHERQNTYSCFKRNIIIDRINIKNEYFCTPFVLLSRTTLHPADINTVS